MAVTKSQLFTNLTASPPVMTTVSESHGRKRAKVCRITTTAALYYALCRLNSGDRIISVKVWNIATANASDCDIGLYAVSDGSDDPSNPAGGDKKEILVDDMDLTSAQAGIESLGTGSTPLAEGLVGAACYTLAGDSVNTVSQYDVYLKLNGFTAAKDATIIIEYLAGD